MSAPTFVKRSEIHDVFMSEIARDLTTWGHQVSMNGRENIHPSMQLSQSNDPGSRWIRFTPDCAVMVGRKTVYVDAKDSDKVEKDPYLHYMDMWNNGIHVYIVARRNGVIRFSHIDDLELKIADHAIWPIDDDGWIAPRAHPRYDEFKHRYPLTGRPYGGSGTAFREIDFSYMCLWGPLFWTFDINPRIK